MRRVVRGRSTRWRRQHRRSTRARPTRAARRAPASAFSDSEAGVTFRCQLDGGGFSTCSSPQSYSGLAEGAHSFQVKARDALGNESAYASYSWTVDTLAPPSPTIDSSPPDPSNSASASFSFSDSEAGVSFLCQLDGGGFSACTRPQAYSGLGRGRAQLPGQGARRSRQRERGSPTTAGRSTPPRRRAPRSTRSPPDPSNSTSASFTFSDSEAGVSFRCQLDGGGFSACTRPQSYSGLAQGGHSFQVKARDAAGNESARHAATAGRSTRRHRRPRRSTRSPPTRATRRAPASRFSDSEAGASFLCQLDGAGFSACSSPQSYTGLAEGNHSFQVKARDAPGNESARHELQLDGRHPAPPTPTIDSSPPDPSSSTNASFTFSDSEAGRQLLLPARRRRLQRLQLARRATAGSPRARTPSTSRRATRPATRARPRATTGRSSTCRRSSPWSHPRTAARRSIRRRRSAAWRARRSAIPCSWTVKVYTGATPTGTPIQTVVAAVGLGRQLFGRRGRGASRRATHSQAEQDDLTGTRD